jgi:hypothetical protein
MQFASAGRQSQFAGWVNGGHCPPYKAWWASCWIGQAQAPGLRLLRRRAPRNDMRAVETRDSEPSRGGRGRNCAEQSQFPDATIKAKCF